MDTITTYPMASEEPTRGEINRNISSLENPKQMRGRKKLKPTVEKKKKLAQRGMGVAQLERLRITGHRKSPPPPPVLLQPAPILPSHLGQHFFLPAQYPDPVGAGYRQMGLNQQAFWLQRLGYGGGGLGCDQGQVGFGRMDVGYLSENSKELSSMPNNTVPYPADKFGLCHKKKRVNGGSLGCSGITTGEKDGDPSLINGFSFNVGNRQQIHGINVDKGVEVVGSHKKGNSGAFMEYDLFPRGKCGRGSSTNELDLSLFSEASVAALGGGGEGSCVTTTTAASGATGFDASTSIDLSLKLSCTSRAEEW